MGIIEITLGLLLAVAAVAALGKWIPVPLPILLVAGGIALSYLPGFDDLRIEQGPTGAANRLDECFLDEWRVVQIGRFPQLDEEVPTQCVHRPITPSTTPRPRPRYRSSPPCVPP